MKILVAGTFRYPFRCEVRAQTLEKLGNQVVRFRWGKYFKDNILNRLQARFVDEPIIDKINNDLVDIFTKTKPDVVFINRGNLIKPQTLLRMKDSFSCRLVSFNNDDPFGAQKGKRIWKYFVDAIPYYDLHFVFRSVNVPEYNAQGSPKTRLLKPYFIPSVHFPIKIDPKEYHKYSTDVVFAGNARGKMRLDALKYLIDNDIDLKIYGNLWKRHLMFGYKYQNYFNPPVWDLDYTRAIKGAKIALAFYSVGNRDTYSDRSFEIPAIGTCMLSMRTNEMQEMFREGIEALYFSDQEELLEKTQLLLTDSNLRNYLSMNALQRVHDIGASVDDRMSEFLSIIQAEL